MVVKGEGTGDWGLRMVGPLTVVRDQRPLEPAEVGSRKARSLLAVLAVHRSAVLPADRLVAALWPDRPPRNPAENIATLVSRLRTALGPGAVAGGRAGYRLGDLLARGVDLDEAARLVRTARDRAAGGEPALALTAARRALGLLGDGGVLVDEVDADWAEPARLDAERLLRTARHVAAAAALELGEPATAIATARAAADVDPLDETAARLLMRAHLQAGEPARGLAEYARLRADLAAELGAEPAAETRAVHAALLAEPTARRAAVGGGAGPGPAGVRAQPGRVSGALVGRAAETGRLTERWAAAAAGRAGLVLLTGVAGIGKTWLAEDLAVLAAGTGGRVLRARCYRTERSLFLQPLADAVRPVVTGLPPALLAELAGDDPAALAAVVSDVDGVLEVGPVGPEGRSGSAELERRRAFSGLAGFLRRLAARQPVLLLLDDLHEAGLATSDFLHHLARHAPDAPLLVVATVRSGDADPVLDRLAEVAELLPVEPLSPAAVGRLAADAGRPELTDRLYRLTRGHTLSAVETLRAVLAGDSGVPGSLRDAVLARVGRLGPQVEEVLRAASVLGPPFEPATLAGVLGVPAPDAARRCERALRAGLLAVTGSAYEFSNDLVQEVLSAATPEPTRVQYHRQAADLLADRPEAAAAHAAAAGQPVRAARAWLLAGEQALRRWAAADAERFVDRALAVLSTVDDPGAVELRGRAHLVRGRAREALAAYAPAWADHGEALELARSAGDPRLEMAVLRELAGDVTVGLGRPTAECVPHLEAGVRIARSLGDRASEADLLARLAVVASNRLRFDDAVRHGLAAVAAGRAAHDDAALAAALDGLKTAYAYSGDVAALGPVLAELEPLLRRQGDLWRLQWMLLESAFPAVAAGDWTTALDLLDAGRAVNRRSRYGSYDAWFVVHRGWVQRLCGRRAEALAAGAEAVEVAAAQGGHPWWSAAAHAFLGGTLLAAGDRPAAVRELAAAVRHAERSHAEAHLLPGLAPLAEATGDRDLLERADELLAAVTAPSGAWLLGADAYLAVARGWLAAGEPDRSAAVLAPLAAAADRSGWLPLQALAAEAAADIAAAAGDPATAERERAAAEELATTCGVALRTAGTGAPASG